MLFHVFSTFAPGGPEVRAIDGRYSAATRIQADIEYVLLRIPPRGNRGIERAGLGLVRASLRLAAEAIMIGRQIQKYKPALILTYNLGAIAAVIVVSLTGLAPLIHFEDGFGQDELVRRNRRRNLIRKFVLPSARRVVVPSQSLQKLLLAECKLPGNLVCCIPNGVNTVAFSPINSLEARRALGLPTGAMSFGTVCHLRPEKRLDLLIRAFHEANLPGSILFIAGNGPCREILIRLATDLGLQDRIFWAGEVLASPLHYSAIDVFVSSSDTEQLPLALLEAMSNALPVISTDVGDCGRVLSGSPPQLLVPAGDIQSLAAAMRWAHANPNCLRNIGDANRRHCTANYGHTSMIQRHLAIYNEAIHRDVCKPKRRDLNERI